VIVVQPDGWVWGREEYSNPDWRIVKVPGITVSQASAFLGPEFDIDPYNPSRVLQRRAFKLDIANLPAAVAGVMADHKRQNPSARASLSLPGLLALKIAKPPLTDPNVL
jgi:hypothetical protein